MSISRAMLMVAAPGALQLDRLLQQPPSSPGAQLSHPDGGLAQRHGRPGFGHGGQRKSVAHNAHSPNNSSRQTHLQRDIRSSERSSFLIKKAVPVVLPMGPHHLPASVHPIRLSRLHLPAPLRSPGITRYAVHGTTGNTRRANGGGYSHQGRGPQRDTGGAMSFDGSGSLREWHEPYEWRGSPTVPSGSQVPWGYSA